MRAPHLPPLSPEKDDRLRANGHAPGASRHRTIVGISRNHAGQEWDFIAASIQFEYDPDELATKITAQLVHNNNSKTYV
jgi:hypothetical protein